MMLVIPDVLGPKDLADMRTALQTAAWHDGRETAGYAAARHKRNEQLRADDETAIRLGQLILRALSTHAQFLSFALPLHILSPMFNCYRDSGEYGFHIDNAIRVDPLSGKRIRTDLSCTVFLNDPAEYDGGELIINDTYGVSGIKLPAGHAVVYPGASLHRVSPVTRGQRMASFLWVQSMVQDDAQRTTLFDLDNTIQRLAMRPENAEDVVRLTGTYHNLIRLWAQT